MPQSKNDSRKAKRSVTITDHAVIRYIERVAGISLDNLRASIASGGNIKPAAVSDSALCRHIESVGEISLSFIRSEIYRLTKAALAMRATGVMIENHFYHLNPTTRTIITVLPAGRRPLRGPAASRAHVPRRASEMLHHHS